MMGSRSRAAAEPAWLVGASALTNGLGLVSLLLLREALPSADFDSFAIAFSVSNILAIGASLGFGQYLPRHGAGLSEGEAASTTVGAAGMVLAWGTALATVAVLISRVLGSSSQTLALTTLLCVAAVLGSLATVAQGYFRSQLDMFGFRAPHLARAVASAAGIGFLWLFFREQLTAITAAFVMVGAAAVAAVFSLIPVRMRVEGAKPGLAERLGWLRISIPMVSTTATRSLNRRADVFLIASFGLSGVGDYLLSARIAELLSYVGVAASAKLVPQLARAFREGELGTTGSAAVRRSARLSLWVLPPILLGSVLIWWITVGGSTGVGVFGVLLGAQALRIVFGSVGDVAGAVDLQNFALKTAVASLVVNCLVGAALLPILGIFGAAIGTFFAVLVWSVVLHQKVRASTGLVVGVVGLTISRWSSVP